MEILYYDNGRGGTAISVDGGESVVVKTGRRLKLTETSWEESDEEECGPLSSEQVSAIVEAKAAFDALTEEEAGLSEIVLAYRKRRIAEEQRNPTRQPEKPKRVLDPSVMIEYSDLIND